MGEFDAFGRWNLTFLWYWLLLLVVHLVVVVLAFALWVVGKLYHCFFDSQRFFVRSFFLGIVNIFGGMENFSPQNFSRGFLEKNGCYFWKCSADSSSSVQVRVL